MPSSPEPVSTPPASPKYTGNVISNGVKKEKIDLDEFERRQKLIEEQNRIKKEMLGKALALRYIILDNFLI